MIKPTTQDIGREVIVSGSGSKPGQGTLMSYKHGSTAVRLTETSKTISAGANAMNAIGPRPAPCTG
jgi:hypothetical protein